MLLVKYLKTNEVFAVRYNTNYIDSTTHREIPAPFIRTWGRLVRIRRNGAFVFMKNDGRSIPRSQAELLDVTRKEALKLLTLAPTSKRVAVPVTYKTKRI